MSEPTVSPDDPREAAGDWIGLLIEKGRAEYQVFEVLAELDHAAPEARSIRRALCAIVDVLVVEELPLAEAARASARRLMEQPLARAAALFEPWAACLAAVRPHRGRMTDVVTHFPQWVEDSPPGFRDESLRLMPALLGTHGRSCLAWLPDMARLASAFTPAEDRARFLDLVQAYLAVVPTEDGPRTLAACAALVRTLPPEVLREFGRVCPAEAVYQDGEAADFFDQVVKVVPGLEEGLRLPFVQLMIALAGEAFSSAGYLAGRLPARAGSLPADARVLYLESFRRLVLGAGLAANRFAFKHLPRRLAGGPSDDVRRLVETVEAIGTNYGRAAAMRFLESQA